MNIRVEPGQYVVAVSGGIDSVVLLDLMLRQPDIKIIVAHFNHGIRLEAADDEEFVRQRAARLCLPFEAGHGYLGNHASEETARNARYKFLNWVVQKHRADAVVTAHHEDDVVETAFLNLLRGTGRRGLVAIKANNSVLRPLLGVSKSEIIDYAYTNRLEWREDPTNFDTKYLRNAIREQLVTRLTVEKRRKILKNIEIVAKINHEIEDKIATLSHKIHTKEGISRSGFSCLPINLADELVVYWLRCLGVLDFDERTVNRIGIALRTFKENSICPVKGNLKLEISKSTAEFTHSV